MIAYIYGVHFDSVSDFATTKSSMKSTLDQTELAIYHANLFVTADKYLLPGLCNRTRAMFGNDIASVMRDRPSELCGIASHVYGSCAPRNSLKADITALFRDHAGIFKEGTDFAQLLLDIPELAGDMVRALAEELKATRPMTLNPLILKQRQRTGYYQGDFPP